MRPMEKQVTRKKPPDCSSSSASTLLHLSRPATPLGLDVVVDGPCPAPNGWISIATHDGLVRIYDSATFLADPPSSMLKLAHLLRPFHANGCMATVAPSSPPIAHAWTLISSHLAVLCHSSVAVYHVSNDGALPRKMEPTMIRPCAEARCLDVSSPSCIEGREGCRVVVGGSFGLEIHEVPSLEARPPRRVLNGAPVALIKFSDDGEYIAVSCLDGRIGAYSVNQLLEASSSPLSSGPGQSNHKWCSRKLPWTPAVVRGERATCLAFSHHAKGDGIGSPRRLAIASADHKILMLRHHTEDSSWRLCPAFFPSLHTTHHQRTSSTGLSSALVGGLSWCFVVWSPENRFLAFNVAGRSVIAVLDANNGTLLSCIGLGGLGGGVGGAAAAEPGGLQGMCSVTCGSTGGTFLQCLDAGGRLHTMEWHQQIEEQQQQQGMYSNEEDGLSMHHENRSLCLLNQRRLSAVFCDDGGADGANEEEETEVLHLIWTKWRSEIDHEPDVRRIKVPFLPRNCMESWRGAFFCRSSQAQKGGRRGSRRGAEGGHIVLGGSYLALVMPYIVYVCRWEEQRKGGLSLSSASSSSSSSSLPSLQQSEEEDKVGNSSPSLAVLEGWDGMILAAGLLGAENGVMVLLKKSPYEIVLQRRTAAALLCLHSNPHQASSSSSCSSPSLLEGAAAGVGVTEGLPSIPLPSYNGSETPPSLGSRGRMSNPICRWAILTADENDRFAIIGQESSSSSPSSSSSTCLIWRGKCSGLSLDVSSEGPPVRVEFPSWGSATATSGRPDCSALGPGSLSNDGLELRFWEVGDIVEQEGEEEKGGQQGIPRLSQVRYWSLSISRDSYTWKYEKKMTPATSQ